MKASEIIARARSLADLQASEAIDATDQKQAINEAWKNTYHVITQRAVDDYFCTRVTIAVTAGMQTDIAEWMVPLPADCAFLRYVEYQANGYWTPMDRFSVNARVNQSPTPCYRIKQGNLWVIGSSMYGLDTVRITYYPPPADITLPQDPLDFCTALVQAGKSAAVGRPYYAEKGRTLIYHSATAITAESYDSTTITPLLTGLTAVKQPIYYKGYLYWIDTTIRRGATELVATIAAPVNLAIAANEFIIYNDLIYYTNGVAVRSCSLTGGGDALVYPLAAISVEVVAGNIVCTTAGGSVYVNGALVTGTASILATDGTYLYSLLGDKTLHRYSVSATAITDLGIIASDVGAIGKSQTRLGVVFFSSQDVQAIDLEFDYDFTYPVNLVPEYMSYRCAVTFAMKYKADTSQLRDSMANKYSELDTALVKQDNNNVDRVQNFNRVGLGWSY